MEINVGFHPEAREEYLETIAWYLTHSAAIARGFQNEMHEAVDRIREGPSQWPIFVDRIRWIRLHRFPYILYFEELSTESVQVLAVAHASRRPGYWQARRRM